MINFSRFRPAHYRLGLRRATLAFAGAVLLGACSTNSTLSTTSTSVSSSSTSTSSTPSTTSTLPPPQCATAVLHAASTAGGAAAGTSYSTFTLTNNGPSPCSLRGFPSVEFFGPSGAGGAGAGPKLAITAQDSTQTPAVVVLDHGGAAEFLMFIHEVPVGGVGCATVASVDIAPPGSSESLSVPATFDACGGSVTVDALAPPGSENP